MSKRTKYVPKHRDAPERPLVEAVVEAPKRAVRNTVVMSSVALAVTGVAVSGGLLSGAGDVSSAADDIATTVGSPLRADSTNDAGSTTDAGDSGDAADRERPAALSRSSDRRDATDPVKAAALSVEGGPAVTEKVQLSQGDPRDIARALLPQFGFSSDQFGCLDSLWMRESGWNPAAHNPSSGAHGIPQSLPGSKMASVGADWATNPATQIEWGLGYIRDRYGSPCGAWAHSESVGWY